MTGSSEGSQCFYHMFFRSLALVQLHTRQTYCYIKVLIASFHRLRTKVEAPAKTEAFLSQLELQLP